MSFLAFALAVVMWSAIGYNVIKRDLRTIEQFGVTGAAKKGVSFSLTRTIRITVLMLAGGIAVILLAFYIVYFQPFWTFLITLLLPFPGAILITSAAFCWRWQRKNKRTLYLEGGKMYPYPYMENGVNQENIKNPN